MLHQAFPGGLVVKNPPANAGDTRLTGFDPWVGKIPWRRKWQPSPVFLPGKSHGQRSLVGYCPLGHKESDTTKGLSTHTHHVASVSLNLEQFSVLLLWSLTVLKSAGFSFWKLTLNLGPSNISHDQTWAMHPWLESHWMVAAPISVLLRLLITGINTFIFPIFCFNDEPRMN